MSRIVCNSGPLIALGLLDRLDLLKELFGEVLVPETVRQEVESGGAADIGLRAFRAANWLRVLPLKNPDPLLESLLDAGEAAVITLAREQAVNLVLIDERKARKVARNIHGLQVIGTARVLVEAKKKGLLDKVQPALEKLRQHGYWIDDSIVAVALSEAGEK